MMNLSAFSISIIIGMVIITVIFSVVISINKDKVDMYHLGAFTAAHIILFLFGQLFQNWHSLRNERKDHAQHIYKVYKLLTIVTIVQGKFSSSWEYFLRFSTEYKSFVSASLEELLNNKKSSELLYEDELEHYSVYDYYKIALDHLEHRKYKHIYKHWEKTKKLLDELNDKVSIEERLQGVIKEKMNHYFPALQNATFSTELSDHYNVNHIVQFMISYFMNRDGFSNYALDSLAYGESDNKLKFIYSEWWPNNFHIIIRSDNNLAFETYKKLVIEMLNDSSLKNFYNEFDDKHKNITRELTDFTDKLDELANDLKIGVPLKGKCKACPS